jgi:hypothetical protein
MRVLPIVVAVLSTLVAACTGGLPAPTPSASTPSASSAASSAAGPAGYWLRMTTTQAIPPLNQFSAAPPLVIDGQGVAVVSAPVPAIYPGPLVVPLSGRAVSDAGRATILQEARDLGLLAGQTDFRGTSNQLAGGITGHIELTVDGQRVTLTGDPSAHIECITTPCDPPPGSPAAFGELWRRLSDLPSWLGADLGPESPYVPDGYSILVGPPPAPDPVLAQAPADWPLSQPLATFGTPVANGTARCGTVRGADADALRPAFAAANALTPWVQDLSTNATFGLTVRPLVDDEDACREVFGV